MKVHPIISIFLGIIAIFIMLTILAVITGQILNGVSSTASIILFFMFIIGGFIATYYSKDEKIRYGAYTGLILSVLTIIIAYNNLGSNEILMAITDIILISLTTGFGGFLAKLSEKTYRDSFKTRNFIMDLIQFLL
jgi:amino acid transporter